MPAVRFGDHGAPLLYLPTSEGDQGEFERYGMHLDCARWIDSGAVQIFSIDAGGPRSLFDDRLPPPERMARYAAFERYAAEEVLPWIESLTGSAGLAVIGASYGAFMAANLLFKHYDRVQLACGLGGVYGMWHRLDGFHDDDVYFHTPLEYVPRLAEGAILDSIRRTSGLVMFGAERDVWLESTRRMQRVLAERSLPHEIEIWPAPADHHERWWKLQLRRFLERRF